MELNKVIIIGSGPAGTWAAKALADRGIKPLILDIGDKPTNLQSKPSNLYEEKEKGAINRNDIFLGSNHEALHNIFYDYLSPKLKSPLMRFVTKSNRLTPLQKNDFHALTSSAMGGLANVWGGHVYRFNESEIKNLNLDPYEFNKYYDIVGSELKISGSDNDSFSEIIPNEKNLTSPMRLDQLWNKIITTKTKQIEKSKEKNLYIGHPRIAIDSEKYTYHNLDFHIPSEGDLYSPRFTLTKLIEEKKVDYIDQYLFTEYQEFHDHVLIHGQDIKSGKTKAFKAEKILIACGAINSTRSVLRSEKAFNKKLPFLDNAITYIPFIDPHLIGAPQETKSYTAQLNLLLRDSGTDYYGTFYNLHSIMRSEIIFDFPLPLTSAIFSSKNLIQAMSILQLWAPGEHCSQNSICLNENNEIQINYKYHRWGSIPKLIIKKLRPLGLYSHSCLAKNINPGNSYHYAGSLPMSTNPSLFQTDLSGKLHGRNRIHIIDSSIFPTLPSKNLTYTIMANAYRIGSGLEL